MYSIVCFFSVHNQLFIGLCSKDGDHKEKIFRYFYLRSMTGFMPKTDTSFCIFDAFSTAESHMRFLSLAVGLNEMGFFWYSWARYNRRKLSCIMTAPIKFNRGELQWEKFV